MKLDILELHCWGWVNEVENSAGIREFCCVLSMSFVDVRCIGFGGKEGRKESIGLR